MARARMRLCELLLSLSGGIGGECCTDVGLCRLKLHIYRSLGISATQDPTTGEFNRAVVRRSSSSEDGDGGTGRGRGDVNVINVDGKFNRGLYTSAFWDAL